MKTKRRPFNKSGTNGGVWTLVCLFSFAVHWAALLILYAVAANAGIPASCDIYDTTSTGDAPPPKPNLKIMDINLIGVIHTVFLAQHYLKRNHSPGGKIIVTASSAALYPMEFSPLYASSKSGVSRSSKHRCKSQQDLMITDTRTGAIHGFQVERMQHCSKLSLPWRG